MKTLKQLLDQVNGESGFDTPSAYIGNVDPNIVQMVAIANRSAVVLRDMHLQKMIKQASIAMSGGIAIGDGRVRSYALPSDFYSLVPDTTYQSGRLDNAILPSSAPVWAYITARMGIQTLPIRCRFIDGRLEIFSPMVKETLNFEYISNAPIQGSSGGSVETTTPLTSFTKDTDVWILDDALIELDIKWRYKREKGLDWQGDLQDFTLYSNELRARDQGARTIGYPKDWPYPNEPFTNLQVG